jgi:hypothetical protein
MLDGDDALASPDVLSYLEKIYRMPVWVTYGQYTPLSETYKNMCQPVIDTQRYRKSGLWTTTHLKTFKRWIFNRIEPRDLRNAENKEFKSAWDRAIMYPLIEMAGVHACFIDKVLYLYNDLNPMNDMKTIPDDTVKESEYLMSKPKYKEL